MLRCEGRARTVRPTEGEHTVPQKEQFTVMMDELDLDRLDALRIVLGVSRAEIVRRLAATYLSRMELAPATRGRLSRLYVLAARRANIAYDPDESDPDASQWREMIRELTANRQTVPTLEELENDHEVNAA